jgi:quercetin dioxygenase-like cupin family protein
MPTWFVLVTIVAFGLMLLTGGRESTEVEAGCFFHVPPGLIHRDVNPADEPQEIVLSLIGDGPLVVNVDGPEAD